MDPRVPASSAQLSSDADGDGLTLAEEALANTHPVALDSDVDGLPDRWEVVNGLNPVDPDDRDIDLDQDGLLNYEEFERGTLANDFYNGEQLLLSIAPPAEGDEPGMVIIKASKVDGTPWSRAPLQIQLDDQEGGAQMALAADSTWMHRKVIVWTDEQGLAQVYLRKTAE
jgi:hypothetical protein